MRTLGLAALLLACACQSDFHVTYHRSHGAWLYEQIDATDWPAEIKKSCKARQVLPGMTKEQAEAAWGKPDRMADVNGAPVWIYREADNSAWDGTYLPQRSLRFDDAGLVLSISSG